MPLRPSVLRLLPLLGLTQCTMSGKGYYPVIPMPEATQLGLNTAGCVVDGLPWVANIYDRPIGGPPASPVSADWDNLSARPSHDLALYFLKNIPDQEQVHYQTTIELKLPGLTQTGTYVLDQTTSAHAVFTFRKTNPVQVLRSGPADPGRVVVTRFDSLAHTVSGTFEFTARQATTGRTVRVTEGRFDCKF